MTLALAAAVAAAYAGAQDEDAQQEEGAKAPAGEAAEAESDAGQSVKPAPAFTALPFCRLIEPPVDAKKPNGDWEPAIEGKFYPLGTSYRAGQGGKLIFSLGTHSTVTIENGASFGTRAQPVGEQSRTLVLGSGVLTLQLAENLPEGALFVAAPGFTVKNPAGESRISYELTPNGDKATVRCVTGALGISGRHFDIPSMRAANEVVVTSEHDYLVTVLEGTSGDYSVILDQGRHASVEVDENGMMKEVVNDDKLDWKLSPKTRVVITRAVPAIGSRMSVHTMAFDAAGERQSDRVFCEGRAEINSGELVHKAATNDEMAKQAAAAETTEAAAETTEDAPAESESSDSSDSSEE